MNERIKELRSHLGMTQQAFADSLNIPRNNIAGYETGKRSPSDAVISLICKEFDVSEEWLRNGNGDMFIKKSRNETIADFAEKLMKDEEDSFRRRLIEALAKLDEKQWEVLADIAENIVKSKTSDLDIDSEVQSYRESLELEKKVAGRSSVSNTEKGVAKIS